MVVGEFASIGKDCSVGHRKLLLDKPSLVVNAVEPSGLAEAVVVYSSRFQRWENE